ncbi:hypothetical protein [Halomicrococcus sp. SG-WS-1]|uniref:hypothetical protein n=1 Tax=Halomicrococcus sp. SG-WS-1 TaxID=3439057 RepID=UPI003F7A9965
MTLRLDVVRSDPTRRWSAYAVAAFVGLTLATVHPLGFLVGGALVSLPTRNWRRGLLAGLAFGVLGWLAFAALLAASGSLGRYLDTGRLLAVSVAIPVLAGLVGGLARALD